MSVSPSDIGQSLEPMTPVARPAITRRIVVRVLIAMILIVTGYMILSTFFINSYTNSVDMLRRNELQRIVELALNALQPIRQQQANGTLNESEALAAAIASVRRLTYHYGDRGELVGYLTLIAFDGTELVGSSNSSTDNSGVIPTNRFNDQDANGQFITRDLIAIAKSLQGRGFYESTEVSSSGTVQPKLTYVAGISEWDVFIATSVDLKDLHTDVQGYTSRALLLTIALIALMILVVYLTLRPVLLGFYALQHLFSQVMQNPDSAPDVPLMHFAPNSEGWQLLKSFQIMLNQIHQSKKGLLERELGLEQRAGERAQELLALLNVSRNVASTLDLRLLLDTILKQFKSVVDYHGASIFTVESADKLKLLEYWGPVAPHELRRDWSLEHDLVNREVILSRGPVIIPDVQSDTTLARAFRTALGSIVSHGRSFMGVPLIARDRVVGMVGFDHAEINFYTDHHAQLAMAFAYQAAAAMENARLFQDEQERRQEAEQRRQVAEGLRDVLTLLNSHTALEVVLDRTVTQAARLLGTNAAAIFRLNHETGILTIQTAYGLPEEYVKGMSVPVGESVLGRAVKERRPDYVPDRLIIVPNLSQLADNYDGKQTLTLEVMQKFGAVLATPLIIKDEVYGGIVLYYTEARPFSQEQLDLIMAFADQAALAIENARLRAQTEESAAAAERQRLARELHDSVTQTLFSASLIAEVLPRLYERNAGEAKSKLDELRLLQRGALAEMRTLLLELRPSVLTDIRFSDLLRQLSEAMTGRTRVPIVVDVQAECQPPPDVQVALYRIAQEALNNVAKHAHATEIQVTVRCLPDGVDLTIYDNGRGFDRTSVTADHFGLKIMGERAETIGATIHIDTQPDEGTIVTVRWRQAIKPVVTVDGLGD